MALETAFFQALKSYSMLESHSTTSNDMSLDTYELAASTWDSRLGIMLYKQNVRQISIHKVVRRKRVLCLGSRRLQWQSFPLHL